MNKHQVALCLADAFLAGPAMPEEMRERAALALGRNWRWIRGLSNHVHARYGFGLTHCRRDELAALIGQYPGFTDSWMRDGDKPQIRFFFLNPPAMAPLLLALPELRVPPLPTSGDLARWLELEPEELDWFADRWTHEQNLPPGPLHHYVYRWVPKRNGTARLLEIPKHRLRAIQRRLLHEILDALPAHGAAHGFRRGHSCLTYVQPHVGQPVVLRMDLKNFFPSVPAARVHVLFRTIGYPEEVARKLTGLCTHRTHNSAFSAKHSAAQDRRSRWQARQQYAMPHLPQGAPTSPALANLCAYRLDVRLAAAAEVLGARYTRYADDLAFSGGEQLARSAQRFHLLVCRIALEQGFEVNTRKTRVMRQSVRQRLTGIVVNAHPNLARGELDALKATLFNCVRFGPQSQNIGGHADFRAHLAGRIAYVQALNPLRGETLQKLFGRIEWN
jgi:RNA-directed DNA polymerase